MPEKYQRQFLDLFSTSLSTHKIRQSNTVCESMCYSYLKKLFLSNHCNCEDDFIYKHKLVFKPHEKFFKRLDFRETNFFVHQRYIEGESAWIVLKKIHFRCNCSVKARSRKYKIDTLLIAHAIFSSEQILIPWSSLCYLRKSLKNRRVCFQFNCLKWMKNDLHIVFWPSHYLIAFYHQSSQSSIRAIKAKLIYLLISGKWHDNDRLIQELEKNFRNFFEENLCDCHQRSYFYFRAVFTDWRSKRLENLKRTSTDLLYFLLFKRLSLIPDRQMSIWRSQPPRRRSALARRFVICPSINPSYRSNFY